MKPQVPEKFNFPAIYQEVNRLRRRDGLESASAFVVAAKLVSHFHESHNPRVAEALVNVSQQQGGCQTR